MPRPAPGESPAITIRLGSTPLEMIHPYARSTSSRSAGKGCSGASRYSGPRAVCFAAAVRAPITPRWPYEELNVWPPPWR